MPKFQITVETADVDREKIARLVEATQRFAPSGSTVTVSRWIGPYSWRKLTEAIRRGNKWTVTLTESEGDKRDDT